jgi:hypothetical protein
MRIPPEHGDAAVVCRRGRLSCYDDLDGGGTGVVVCNRQNGSGNLN